MASTGKVLGAIGALHTLIDNFPMSILDLFKGGKTYTSAFEFIMDVLYACGVPNDEIIGFLLDEIYSITPDIENGLEGLKEDIASMDFSKVQQSPFLQHLEEGIKIILNGLFASVYGCSALPILPNKFMDTPNKDSFKGVDTSLWDSPYIYPANFEIPVKLIDPMGLLEITPTTLDGRVYYDTPGGDVYYKKQPIERAISAFNFKRNINFNEIPIKIEIKENLLSFLVDTPIVEDINIVCEYFESNNILKFNTVLKAGEYISNRKLNIKNVLYIKSITLNNSLNGAIVGDNIWCFLEKNDSELFTENFVWGETKNNIVLGASTDGGYEYVKLNDVPENSKSAKRLNNVPSSVNENDADLIVVYDGMNANELYKSNDLNAFIWYSLVKGSRATQVDINQTMWDSRLSAQKKGISRETNTEWNDWYNSKETSNHEFLFKGKKITKESNLYPIIQLKKSDTNLYALNVTFPSQRYFKPKTRESNLGGQPFNGKYEFNSSIYAFNKDYIDSIQLFKPKLLLTSFVNYMLGFSISAIKSVDINITKKIIESKLSSSIKKIIEADDMEIEDCYTSFSNEEFDEMLEEMLLSRYTSTIYGGETNKTKKHDVESYISLIDSFNMSTTREESISKITRLVTEVTATAGTEGSISYGLDATIDANLLNKLIWAITMPIMESLFTPQLMLLMAINMGLTGMVKIDDFLNNDISLIMNLIFNKILGLTKSIIKYVKDVIVELLIKLFMQKITPLLIKYTGALYREKLEYWLELLLSALKCLPKLPQFDFGNKYKKTDSFSNDVVDYADIIYKEQLSIPESSLPC